MMIYEVRIAVYCTVAGDTFKTTAIDYVEAKDIAEAFLLATKLRKLLMEKTKQKWDLAVIDAIVAKPEINVL